MEKKKRVFTDASKESMRRYDAENTTQIKLKLNNKTDAEILEKLQSVENKQGYIKRLILEDLRRDDLK